MALWKEQASTTGGTTPTSSREPSARDSDKPTAVPLSTETRRAPRAAAGCSEPKESVIAADLTIEGKIEGSGHVRIAGRFKGDVSVQGNLTSMREPISPGRFALRTSRSVANCTAISTGRPGSSYSRPAYLPAMSKPGRSRSPPARACAGRSSSAGRSRPRHAPSASRRVTAAPHEQRALAASGPDAHLSALQGDDSRERSRLSGV